MVWAPLDSQRLHGGEARRGLHVYPGIIIDVLFMRPVAYPPDTLGHQTR
jgi:hypothetical protein